MGDWEKLAFVHVAIGAELNVLGLLSSEGGEAVEAMLIIGFLLYAPAMLLFAFEYLPEGDLKGNKIVQIIICCFVLAAALFIIIGVIVWGADDGIGNSYGATLDITSAFMAIIGGVFLILMLVGCAAPSGGGGGGSGSKTSPSSA